MSVPESKLRRCLASTMVVALLLGVSGCFRPPPILDPSFPSGCRVGPADWRSADSLRISHTVNGALDEERLLGSWVLATPICVDCDDEIRPGFASGWTRHDGGRRWSLTLRSGLEFRWGEKLSATEVASTWNSRVATLDAGVDSVAAVGDRVDVYLRRASSSIPRVLASNIFGLRLRRWPAIGLMSANHGDPRDVLEDGVDIMVTLNSDVVDYARRHEDFDVEELPYDRVYVLLCRSRVDARQSGEDVPGITRRLRESLAADAIRSSARAAESDFWWSDVGDCQLPSETVPWLPPSGPGWTGSSGMRIVYEEGDPIARGIAERVVALASAENTAGYREIEAALPGLRSDVRATGMRRLAFDGAFAYIIALPLAVPDPCYERLNLIERVHFLLPAERDLDRALVPLVEARPYAIFRHGAPPLAVDRFGNTRVVR